MIASADRPLIVQSDRTVLLEVSHPRHEEARDLLVRFAELEKSPEHIHTYRISSLSLWNAAAAGVQPEEVIGGLNALSRYPVPDALEREIREAMARYGRVKLIKDGQQLQLTSDDPLLLVQFASTPELAALMAGPPRGAAVPVDPAARGLLKAALLRAGYPVEDLAGYTPGAPLRLALRSRSRQGEPFALRPYQEDASRAFYAAGGPQGGSGVVVLPCGAGKTIIGIAVMTQVQARTLILTQSQVAVHQWIRELLDHTDLPEDAVGEYTGSLKQVRPVTVTTYQILTHRNRRDEAFPHFRLFDQEEWGLIIYDEVHLLPAPVFRVTADLQSRRRLGLTATLVREDGREAEVFSLIGPKKYDLPWRLLESQGWIATARCAEVRVPLPEAERMAYAVADTRERFRIAAENPDKLPVVRALLERHRGEPVLVIGQYIRQLEEISRELGAPLLTGRTAQPERERLYADFRAGAIPVLVVSKVANFAVDLPEARTAIQVSGTFGSRQEEAQRLGRILRPKADGSPAHFYSLVTQDTREQELGEKRQLFLTEQGYEYDLLFGAEVLAGVPR